MATKILETGPYYDESRVAYVRLHWTNTTENGRNKLEHYVVFNNSVSGFYRTITSGSLRIGSQSYNLSTGRKYDGDRLESGTTYVDDTKVTVTLTCNVGGENKTVTKTVDLLPIGSELLLKVDGQYIESIPFLKNDEQYEEITLLQKVNGVWEEL